MYKVSQVKEDAEKTMDSGVKEASCSAKSLLTPTATWEHWLLMCLKCVKQGDKFKTNILKMKFNKRDNIHLVILLIITVNICLYWVYIFSVFIELFMTKHAYKTEE